VTDGAANDRIMPGLMSEENLARRIAWEMASRGWSQERMAKTMTDAGHPLNQSSVSKNVHPQDGKRSAVRVDDAIVFAKGFGVTLDELLIPLEAVWDSEFRDALSRLHDIQQQRDALDREAAALITRMVKLAHTAGEEFFDRHMDAATVTDRRRLLTEMHRWAQRLMAQADEPALADLPDEEALERLRRITYGEQP